MNRLIPQGEKPLRRSSMPIKERYYRLQDFVQSATTDHGHICDGAWDLSHGLFFGRSGLIVILVINYIFWDSISDPELWKNNLSDDD